MTQLLKNTGLSSNRHSNFSSDRITKSKPQGAQPNNTHLITFITFIALLPLVYFIPDVVGQFLPAIKWLTVVVSLGFIVPIISYVVMPIALLVLIQLRK